jgi:hypothetical protein
VSAIFVESFRDFLRRRDGVSRRHVAKWCVPQLR